MTAAVPIRVAFSRLGSGSLPCMTRNPDRTRNGKTADYAFGSNPPCGLVSSFPPFTVTDLRITGYVTFGPL